MQQKKVTPRYTPKHNHLKPHPDQHVVMNPSVENVVRVIAGVNSQVQYNQGRLLNFFPWHTPVGVAMYHRGAQEFILNPSLVSKLAVLGVRYAALVEVFQYMYIEELQANAMWLDESNEITVPVYVTMESLYAGVEHVLGVRKIKER